MMDERLEDFSFKDEFERSFIRIARVFLKVLEEFFGSFKLKVFSSIKEF